MFRLVFGMFRLHRLLGKFEQFRVLRQQQFRVLRQPAPGL
ncbi:hypothetical protein FRUB_05520 [Fimbriiglobus ruber]|uniref:Uncharacterized protein n=1 Tax=Fimbriiglobus ruber TaxID=1908690 RepID=A0A225DGC2_9BACT|nr:hypothetical protein FRUB_05520 [Fimbriiglobus ruber]